MSEQIAGDFGEPSVVDDILPRKRALTLIVNNFEAMCFDELLLSGFDGTPRRRGRGKVKRRKPSGNGCHGQPPKSRRPR